MFSPSEPGLPTRDGFGHGYGAPDSRRSGGVSPCRTCSDRQTCQRDRSTLGASRGRCRGRCCARLGRRGRSGETGLPNLRHGGPDLGGGRPGLGGRSTQSQRPQRHTRPGRAQRRDPARPHHSARRCRQLPFSSTKAGAPFKGSESSTLPRALVGADQVFEVPVQGESAPFGFSGTSGERPRALMVQWAGLDEPLPIVFRGPPPRSRVRVAGS